MLTVGSLCAGMDGLGLACERAGLRVRWQVELREWCRRLLAIRYPRSQLFEDVNNVGLHNLRPVDAIVAGFPCQDISGAGHRAGIKGKRSGLWYEVARVIRELRPAIVLLENADEICAPIRERGTGRVIDAAPGFAVLATLAEMGFDAQWGVVGAAHSGAPHERLRWWCIAWNVSNANHIRQQKSQTIKQYSSYAKQHPAARITEREAVVYAPVASGQGYSIPYASSQRLQRQTSITSRHEEKVATIAVNRGDRIGTNESDLGGIMFNGLPSRLERQARTQLYAAPLGMQPYAFEPSRLTHDDFDWKDRIEALGNSVAVPTAQAVAECAKELLDALYGANYQTHLIA